MLKRKKFQPHFFLQIFIHTFAIFATNLSTGKRNKVSIFSTIIKNRFGFNNTLARYVNYMF